MAIYKLGDIGQVKMCKRVLLKDRSLKSGIPFFTIKTLGSEPDHYISKNLYNKLKTNYRYPRKGTALFTASGTIGKYWWFDGRDCYFQDSNIVWFESNKILQKYFYYWLSKLPFKATSGSTIKRLYNKTIYSTKIDLPNIKMQGQIIDIIEPYESLFLKYPKLLKIDTVENAKTCTKKIIDIIEPLDLLENKISNIKKIIKNILVNSYKNSIGKCFFFDYSMLSGSKYNNQKFYYDTSSVGEFEIFNDKIQHLKLKKPSRANLTVPNKNIIFQKLVGEAKVLYINKIFAKNVYSTGFFSISTNYVDHYVGFILSKSYKIQKGKLSIGTTMRGLNNKTISKIMIKKPPYKSDELSNALSNLLILKSILIKLKRKMIEFCFS